MFMGEYNHNLDAKNRLMLPSKLREGIGEGSFVLTRGLDNCLFLFPMEEWHIFEDKIKALSVTKKDARAFVRFIFSGAVNDILDKQGRLTIPENLKEYGKIDKEVVISGALNRIEIWSKEVWSEYIKGAEESFEEIAENLIDLLS